jgi:hypothetical protein
VIWICAPTKYLPRSFSLSPPNLPTGPKGIDLNQGVEVRRLSFSELHRWPTIAHPGWGSIGLCGGNWNENEVEQEQEEERNSNRKQPNHPLV